MQEITFNNRIYTDQDIIAMRGWLNLYAFANWETERIDNFTPLGVLEITNIFYSGGVIKFNNDHYYPFRPPFMKERAVIYVIEQGYEAKIMFVNSGRSKKVPITTWERYFEQLRAKQATVHIEVD